MGIKFSIVGRKRIYNFEHSSKFLTDLEKKHYRIEIGNQLGKSFIVFHAVLLKHDKGGYLIIGDSQSGKSTLASNLRSLDFSIAANDFVVCWEKNGKLIGGDLNLVEKNINKKEIDICGMIFLTNDKRDCFVPSLIEIKDYYYKSIESFGGRQLNNFNNFTRFFKLQNINKIALGNRCTPDRWFKALRSGMSTKKAESIGILGMGTVGKNLSNLLMGEAWVKKFHVLSRNTYQLRGELLDLRSANNLIEFYRDINVNKFVKNSDIIVVCFRQHEGRTISKTRNNERFIHLYDQLPRLWSLSRAIRKNSFSGKIIIVTNPADILAWVLYYFSNVDDNKNIDWGGLISNQIVGMGLGLDYARLQTKSDFKNEVLGEHGKNILLARMAYSRLELLHNNKLRDVVINYSENIRKNTDRTKYGPAHEILRLIRVFIKGKGIIRVSNLNDAGVFLGDIFYYQRNLFRIKYQKAPKLMEKMSILNCLHKGYQQEIINFLGRGELKIIN